MAADATVEDEWPTPREATERQFTVLNRLVSGSSFPRLKTPIQILDRSNKRSMTRSNGRTSDKRRRLSGSPELWSDGEPAEFEEQQHQGGNGSNINSSAGDFAAAGSSVMSITCDACRKKKVRCPSEKPSCSTCLKTGVQCVYRQRMKPGLKRGAGEATSRRLDLLETQLREHQARIYHLEQQQQMANMQSLTAPPTTSPASVVAPAGPSVSSAFDLAAFSQSIQQAPHPPPPVSSMSIQPSPGVVSHHSDPANSPHTTIRGGEESSVLDSLPAAVVQSLLDLYQAHLGPTLPLFSPNMSFTWPWTLPAFAMVAAALRLPQATRLLAQPEQIRLACRRHVIATATETTTVETLQALTIIVQDTIASGAEPSNWGTLALLTRSIRHLGLVDCLVDNSAEKGRLRLLPKATTPQEAESHRRLFWCTWMLDRFSCASTGWDLAISHEETVLELPSGDHIWTAAQPLPAPVFVSVPLGGNMDMTGLHEFAHLIRVVDMLGRVAVHQSNHPMVLDETNTQAVQDRAHDGRVLLNALETAQQCIPRAFTEAAAMGTATPLQYQVIGTYHTTVLKLCASLAYPVGRSGPAQEPFCERLRASTAAAGRLAIAILRAGRVHDMSPMMAWCLWVSARISFVDSYMNNKEPSAEFNAVLDLLQAMSNTWAVADKYTRVLQRASLAWREHLASGHHQQPGQDSNHNPPVVSALTDFRSHAYSALRADANSAPSDQSTFSLADLYSWLDVPDLTGVYPNFTTGHMADSSGPAFPSLSSS